MSTSALQWDVVIGDQPACATPCSIVVLPLQYVTMHTHEYRPVQLDVGMLPPGDLMVHAVPLRRGEYAAGVTFVTLGSMALATGVTLGAVGYGAGSSGLVTAGWATAIPGAIVLAGSIWLMQHALPHWF